LTNLACHLNIGHTFAPITIINCRMSVVRKKNKVHYRKVQIFLLLPQRMFFLQITPDFWQSSMSQMLIDRKCQLRG
jgi:hypothetical protein